jgi:hypothetical protein
LLVTDNGLAWKATKRRVYEALGSTGKYFLITNTGRWRECSRLWFVSDRPSGVHLPQQFLLGVDRPKNLMVIAEIHNVTNP